jgi:CRISPR-associated endonuclease/helicase Cas3
MDFATWYTQRHGYAPFPWQNALAARVAADDWPDALTPPTGTGKTAVIDVWLWAQLAGYAMPRRLVYVIDRRLIVDGVRDYANALTATLPTTQRPLVTTMRGGVTIEDDWLDPVRPAIIVTTVDQAGSRLLFRGYGVSARAAPVHAALLANDALWVLDEVHLAEPLLRTLRDVARLRGTAFGSPLRILPMSATYASRESLGLGDNDYAHPVLRRRLQAAKPARLKKITADEDLPASLAHEAVALRKAGAEVVAAVCNRVATARAVFEYLAREGESILLIGRTRPADRDVLLAECLPCIATGTRGSRTALYVVATQTIEVGADLDFDALVSECAPLSALRQRAGRLNRLGELASAPMTIVYQPRDKDRVYGDLPETTWKWLTRLADKRTETVDFGIVTLEGLIAREAPPEEPAPRSPVLLSAHVDLLAQTSASGAIDVAPWLHGWQSGSADVSVGWRGDWSVESVEAAPPTREELMQLPVYALQQWADDIADIEGGFAIEVHGGRHLPCVQWDGESATLTDVRDAHPGATIVLPAHVGGCDRWGWAPASRDPVTDVGDTARRIRLHPAVHPELAEDIEALIDGEAGDADWRALARRVGFANPGRVITYPGGAAVLERREATSSMALKPIALNVHLATVGERSATFARAVALPEDLVIAVRRAGHAHDLGKRDLRWQAMIGGSAVEPLAKGPGGDTGWLPRGWRHEMASALLQTDPLVRHLVGTHHGHGRPLFPAGPDLALWQSLAGWGRQFAELHARFGPWGLAYLEALVRLADWQVSEEEQRDAGDEADRLAA